LTFSKTGFAPAQRTGTPPVQDYLILADVALVAYDTQVTHVDLGNLSSPVAHQGSVVNDSAGTRRATLIFPPGTTGTAAPPGGLGPQGTLLTIHARATT